MNPGTIISVASGLVFIGISIPLVRRRVPPNGAYGLRVPATFADDWVWYEANAQSGRDMIVVGILLVIFGISLPFVPGVAESAHALFAVGFLVMSTLTAAIVGWRRANRLLAERPDGADARRY